ESRQTMHQLAEYLKRYNWDSVPMIVVCDNSQFLIETLNNFLWAAFTRTNPSHDIYGVDAFTEFKHWGCRGALIFDARIKPHHAPELIPDEKVMRKVDGLFSKGGELYNKV
ncbi:MAG: 3-octaprenyl-4-hydroxybenzoate carboxy-lyase, partial [Bacteroidota bacterium]